MSPRVLRALFLVHGLVTLAAAVVLVALPGLIPATVGITITTDEYLLAYFLAAAELGVALLSLGATRVSDPAAVGLILLVFIVFHLSTAALEVVYAGLTGGSPALFANVVVRVVAASLFLTARRPLSKPRAQGKDL